MRIGNYGSPSLAVFAEAKTFADMKTVESTQGFVLFSGDIDTKNFARDSLAADEENVVIIRGPLIIPDVLVKRWNRLSQTATIGSNNLKSPIGETTLMVAESNLFSVGRKSGIRIRAWLFDKFPDCFGVQVKDFQIRFLFIQPS